MPGCPNLCVTIQTDCLAVKEDAPAGALWRFVFFPFSMHLFRWDFSKQDGRGFSRLRHVLKRYGETLAILLRKIHRNKCMGNRNKYPPPQPEHAAAKSLWPERCLSLPDNLSELLYLCHIYMILKHERYLFMCYNLRDFSTQASSASITAALIPRCSNAFTPSIVVPPGEQTISFNAPG